MTATVRLGIATDFNGDNGDLEPALSLLAEVFTRKKQPLPVLHYCQYQSTTGMLTDRHISDMLTLRDRYGFQIADLHMSDGNYLWGTTYPADRDTVRAVVRNRLEVMVAFDAKVGVLHSPTPKDGDLDAFFRVVYEDMDLIPYHGSVPMDRDLAFLAKTPYRGPLTMEITQRAYRPVHSMEEYLEMACDNGMRMVRTFEQLIAAA